MRIGFDLDKVLIDYPPFLPFVLFDKLYKKRDNGILLYRIPAFPEQVLRRALHLPFLRQPIKNNLDSLKNISKKENKLYLISSRFKFLEGTTNRFVKRYGLDKTFDALYFNFENRQPHIFKEEVLRKLNLDLYIDDDLSLLKHVAKTNTKTKFLWLNHTNKIQKLPKNIFSIKQVSDIAKYNV